MPLLLLTDLSALSTELMESCAIKVDIIVIIIIITSSTLMFSLALVSNSWMPICCAKVWASAVSTTFLSGSSFLFPTGDAEPTVKDVL